MSAPPRITIVTPILNGGATLRGTIQSVVEQEYPNLEYILVDGGSTDGSLDIAREFSDKISLLIQGRDRSIYDAVAKGFDAATGEIFAWLNSDDLYMPGILGRVGTLFAANADWQVIYGDDAVWKQGWLLANRAQRQVEFDELLAGHVIPQASTFFRRSAYLEVGGLERERLKLAGDYQLWLRLAQRYPLHYVPIQASVFRIRPGQLSGDWSAYCQEMNAVAQGAQACMSQISAPPAPANVSALSRRDLHYPLENETVNWSPIREPPHVSLAECRCPICSGFPQRILFSTPDTRYGDRTVWRIYFCEACETAFRFPRPEPGELDRIKTAAATPDFVDNPPTPLGVYSPFKRGSQLAVRPMQNLLGACLKPAAEVAAGTNLAEIDRPIEFLKGTRETSLTIWMPNLDSFWLRRFGPCWSQWHAPFHAFICGRRGLSLLARAGGWRVESLRSDSPPTWLCRSEKIARLGLATHVCDVGPDCVWRLAQRASAWSRLCHDRAGLGDRLIACLARA